MTGFRPILVLLTLFVFACLPAIAAAQPFFGGSDEPDGNTLVRVTVAAEHEAVSPEQPTDLAIRFDISDGWHVYWKNPGDTGSEMKVNYTGPDWASIGELRWPVPERYQSPGGLLDFVHEKQTILLTELTIDRAAWEQSGSPETLELRLSCEWFVCKDVCLLGEGSTTLRLPVQPSGLVSVAAKNKKLFEQARDAMPVAREKVEDGTYTGRFAEGVLHLSVPGADRLTFFPAPSEILAVPQNSLGEGQAEGDTLAIRYRDNALKAEHLDGVLVIEHGKKGQPGYRKQAIEIRVSVRAAPGTE